MATQDFLVDLECKVPNVEVFCSTQNAPYSCTLNYSDILCNSNKYYIVQILVTQSANASSQITSANASEFYVFSRWGRVGAKGQTSCKRQPSSYAAISLFLKTYREKTSHNWGDANEYIPKNGKYCKMKMAEIDVVEQEAEGNTDGGDAQDTLEQSIKEFIEMIADNKMHMQALKSFNVDVQKMPLGKISDTQIDDAYKILSNIADILLSNKPTNNLSADINTKLINASNSFWTIVPCNSGRTTPPPIICNKEMINNLVDLLEIMKNAKISGTITRRFNNVVDIYKQMNITIESVKSLHERAIIEKFVMGTTAPSHHYKLEVLEMFRITKDVKDNGGYFESLSDHRLLTHGSRMTNFMGILSTGLRVPQPGQVVNGSVLGCGIYFADVITKSFNYCHAFDTSNIGFIALCEVALGNAPDKRVGSVDACDQNEQLLSKQFTSRMALGNNTIEDKNYVILNTDDDFIKNVKVPQGPITTRKATSEYPSGSFAYNEFVIFDLRQIRFSYILKLKSV